MGLNLCDQCAADCRHERNPNEIVVKCGAYKPPMTNADRIRAMSDEELAAVIVKAYNGGDPSFLWCDRKGSCAGEDEEELVCTDERLLACVVRWLGSPAKEGKNSGY